MNHEHVEHHAIVDLYLMDRSDPQEEAAFEEHYLSCDSCLEQLELAEGFQAGFRRVAAEDAVNVAVAGRVGIAAWLARAAASPRAGLLAAAVLVAIALPSTLLYRQLVEERDRAGALATELDAVRAPQTALVLPLSPERSGTGGPPSARIRLPAAPSWIVVSLELARADFESYRVTLVGPEGNPLWRGAELRPDSLGGLTVGLHSSTLRPGDYELRVEATPPTGNPVAAGRFAFHTVPAD